jgi:hypothetical protein
VNASIVQQSTVAAPSVIEPHSELMSPIFEEQPKGSVEQEIDGKKDQSCSPFDKYHTLLNLHNSHDLDKKDTLVYASDSAMNDEDSNEE